MVVIDKEPILPLIIYNASFDKFTICSDLARDCYFISCDISHKDPSILANFTPPY